MAKTVRITTDNKIHVLDIPWNLDMWEAAIGAGCTEIVRSGRLVDFFNEKIVMIVDEGGAVKHRAINRVASHFYGADRHGIYIYGDILLGLESGPDIIPIDAAELVLQLLMERFSILSNDV